MKNDQLKFEVKDVKEMPHFYTKNKSATIVDMSPKEMLACDFQIERIRRGYHNRITL